MAAGLNIGKFSNVFRNRLALMYEMAEVGPAAVSRKKAKLIELVKGFSEAQTIKLPDMDLEKAEAATKSELAKKIKVIKGFYTAEMAPPSLSEMDRLRADIALMQEFIKNKCFLYLTVRQAWLLLLVCTEIALWFYLGETIGKGHIVGYKV